MQARHLILGRISVQNSMLIDLGGIGLKVGCGCDNEIGNNKLFLPG